MNVDVLLFVAFLVGIIGGLVGVFLLERSVLADISVSRFFKSKEYHDPCFVEKCRFSVISVVLIVVVLLLIPFLLSVIPSNETITNDALNTNQIAVAAFILSVISIAISVFQSFVELYIDHGNSMRSYESNKRSYKEKQLKKLYQYMHYTDFENIDLDYIRKYSYLASGELEKYIDDFIRCKTSPCTFRISGPEGKNALYCNVRKAIKKDIKSLKKHLEYYIEIDK